MQQAFADPTQPVNPEDMVATAASHGAVFEPGTQVSYCNTNYHVLGLLFLTETVLEGESPMSDVLAPGKTNKQRTS